MVSDVLFVTLLVLGLVPAGMWHVDLLSARLLQAYGGGDKARPLERNPMIGLRSLQPKPELPSFLEASLFGSCELE